MRLGGSTRKTVVSSRRRSAKRKSEAARLCAMRGLSRKWVWRCLAVGLAEEAVRRAGDEPVRALALLHQRQQLLEAFGRQSQVFAHRAQRPALGVLVDDAEQDQPGDQRSSLLVPVGLAGLAGRIHHQGGGEGAGVLAEVEAALRHPLQRVVARIPHA
jgi:hypothetical protein